MSIRFFTILGLVALTLSCSKEQKPCYSIKTVAIQFVPNAEYSIKDTLQIDDFKFTHVNHMDSIELGNYIPNKTMILADLNGKQAKENANQVGMGMILAKKLNRTNQYNILNGPEILTTGKLRISRKDGKKISLCFPENYQAIFSE